MRWRSVGLVVCGSLGACLAEPEVPAHEATVSIEVSALSLTGVGDVVWDVELVNGGLPTADVVWRQRLASSRFGDGAGSVSYVGPCDATPGVHENTVRLWVVGVYADPVADVGAFASGGDGGVVGAPLEFDNPTTSGPLTRIATCRENADSPVRFDVALMRPADQGFFDIAVNFNDIFCSAKFDCCAENEAGTACVDIALLHDAAGKRSTTMVLGFACTAGPGDAAATELYLDALQLDCTNPTPETFAADVAIDPTAGPGNLCATAGDASTCAGVVGEAVDTWLYQVATYRGGEALQTDGVAGNKVYWNVALGVKKPAIAGCRLRTRGTAMDGAGAGGPTAGVVSGGAVYPYVQWDVDLGACAAEPLTFGDPSAMVRTAYTGTGGAVTTFPYGFGPALPPTANCTPSCPDGICLAVEGGGTTCHCAPGFVTDPELGCFCVEGPCSGATFSGFSAASGAMASADVRLDFQFAPATFSFQATGGAVRLYGTVIPNPFP